jgi:hypothetical protein
VSDVGYGEGAAKARVMMRPGERVATRFRGGPGSGASAVMRAWDASRVPWYTPPRAASERDASPGASHVTVSEAVWPGTP